MTTLIDRTSERGLPVCHASERAMLGSVLIDPTVLDEILLVCEPDDVWDEQRRIVFEAMIALHEEGAIDEKLLLDRLRRHTAAPQGRSRPTIAVDELVPLLWQLSESTPVAVHARHYARIVRRHSMLRRLILACEDVGFAAHERGADPDALFRQLEREVYEVGEKSIEEVIPIGQAMQKAMERHLSGGSRMGVSTGYLRLDEKIGGMSPGQLIILAARTSMGKTALALCVASYVSIVNRVPVLFASLEMNYDEIADRMLLSIDGESYGARVQSCDGAPLVVDDRVRTIPQLAARARSIKREHDGLGLVVVDYLTQLSPANPKENRQEQVASLSRGLKQMARDLACPVLCLAQLNRETEQGSDNKPKLRHLRESGAIEQDADVVLFIHRDNYYGKQGGRSDRPVDATLMVAKNRTGETGDVPLQWIPHEVRFIESDGIVPADEWEPQ